MTILDDKALLIIGFCLILFGYTEYTSGRQDEAVIAVGIFLLIIYWLGRYVTPLIMSYQP